MYKNIFNVFTTSPEDELAICRKNKCSMVETFKGYIKTQTTRRELKIRRAKEYFDELEGLEMCLNTVLRVLFILISQSKPNLRRKRRIIKLDELFMSLRK